MDIPEGFIEWRPAGPGVVEITNIVVLPECRRQGHGRRLIEMALEEIGRAETVYLFSEARNSGAHQFFEACGFRLACRLEQFYNHDGAVMFVRYSF